MNLHCYRFAPIVFLWFAFAHDDVSPLARCTDQAEVLYLFTGILQSKSIGLSAVFDAQTQTTLGTSADYGALVLPTSEILCSSVSRAPLRGGLCSSQIIQLFFLLEANGILYTSWPSLI